MKLLPTILLALTAFATTAAPAHAKPSKAEEKFLAKTWSAATKTYDNKSVETFVKSIGDTGAISSDQAFAAVPVLTATSGGDEGGEIILLVPPADVKKTIDSLKSKTGGKGGSFGNKVILQKLSATFRVVGGEPALVKGGDASKLSGIGKPSALYAKQTAAVSPAR